MFGGDTLRTNQFLTAIAAGEDTTWPADSPGPPDRRPRRLIKIHQLRVGDSSATNRRFINYESVVHQLLIGDSSTTNRRLLEQAASGRRRCARTSSPSSKSQRQIAQDPPSSSSPSAKSSGAAEADGSPLASAAEAAAAPPAAPPPAALDVRVGRRYLREGRLAMARRTRRESSAAERSTRQKHTHMYHM